jgi:hypothetical protein
MTQSHRKSFFGQKTGMVISSRDWAEPFIMLTFIKKKGTNGNEWEKFAEGKILKVNLVELAAIRDVVRGVKPAWKTFHKYNDSGTPIEVRWENDKKETVLFSAGGYVRPVQWPESVVLSQLLDHIFIEKIQYATSPQGAPETHSAEDVPEEAIESPFPAPVQEESPPEKNPKKSGKQGSPNSSSTTSGSKSESTAESKGVVKDPHSSEPTVSSQEAYVPDGIQVQPRTLPSVTEKAVCMENEAGHKIWVPKSAILGDTPIGPTDNPSSFALKGWFVKKKEIKEWIAGA